MKEIGNLSLGFGRIQKKLPNDIITALEKYGIVSLIKDYFNDSIITSYSLNKKSFS